LRVFVLRLDVRQIQSLEFSKRRRTILALLGGEGPGEVGRETNWPADFRRGRGATDENSPQLKLRAIFGCSFGAKKACQKLDGKIKLQA
jgi:hypothetical protein